MVSAGIGLWRRADRLQNRDIHALVHAPMRWRRPEPWYSGTDTRRGPHQLWAQERSSQFTFPGYTTDKPSDAQNEAATLAAEVSQIHTVWPSPPIGIIGHSHGGLIAHLFWGDVGFGQGVRSSYGVTHVFSMDSPVNGDGRYGPHDPVMTTRSSVVYAGSSVTVNRKNVASHGSVFFKLYSDRVFLGQMRTNGNVRVPSP
jgi:hypothetical protein